MLQTTMMKSMESMKNLKASSSMQLKTKMQHHRQTFKKIGPDADSVGQVELTMQTQCSLFVLVQGQWDTSISNA